MSEENPMDAFDALAGQHPELQRLTVPTPPWGAASGDFEAGLTDDFRAAFPVDMSQFPARLTPEEVFVAQLNCDRLLEEASSASSLFDGYLSQLYTVVRKNKFGDSAPTTSEERGFQRKMAALIVKVVPDPAETVATLETFENPEQRARNDTITREFIAAAEEGLVGWKPPQHILDQMVARAKFSLDVTNRRTAYELLLSTLYGDRYQAYLDQTNPPATP